MRVGVIADGYVDANGTLDYLKIVLRGLYTRKDTEIYMFFSSDNQRKLRHIPTWFRKLYELVVPYEHNTSINAFAEFKSLKIVEYKVRNLKKKIIENKIDVVFPAMTDLGKKFPAKWALEFFDCQPKYFPQYFSLKTKLGRDLYFRTSAKHADVIFVNSQAAKRDYCKFYKIPEERIETLPFCATLNNEYIKNDDQTVLEKYGINTPYFLISNQLYAHKRHDIAFQALEIIRKKGYNVSIVCTGKMDDDDLLLNQLKDMISNLDLIQNVKLLGMIPKKDQIELMKQAISVVQPSEFEGDCSGQIIDAITLGQRAIASDIDVIKEVEFTGYVTYFKLDDPNDLADKMMDFINTPYLRPSREKLVEQEKMYLNAFSDAIYRIINKMVKNG